MKAIEKIFSLMTERGISAAQLTKDAYLTVGSITQWKKGTAKPSAENLSKLADYFGVSVDYLLGRTEIRETVTAENQFKIKKAPSLTDEEKQLLDDYRAGISDKLIQDMMGHATLAMTMDTYTHTMAQGSSPVWDYVKRLAEKLKER